MSKRSRYRVLLPVDVIDHHATGSLYGYRHPETGVFNVTACGEPADTETGHLGTLIGTLTNDAPSGGNEDSDHLVLFGRYEADRPAFTCKGQECDVEYYSLVQDVFSRNTGILETNALLEAKAIISGCGSVGSQVSLELARSGIGNFLLIDHDQLAYHNLCRHQCGISDVGRRKVDAVRDRILQINPRSRVRVLCTPIQRAPKEIWDEWLDENTVMVGCADNREADIYANRLSQLYLAPFVSIGLWERAFAGELFWSIPRQTPCYNCAFGMNRSNLSFRSSQNRRIYTTEEDLSKLTFEPGISVDITFVTSIGVKIALDLYGRGKRPMRVLDDLKQFTLVCNSTHVQVAGDLQEIFDHALQVTRSIEVEKSGDCTHCRQAGKGRAA